MLVRYVFALSSPDVRIKTNHNVIVEAHYGKYDDYRLEIVADSAYQKTVIILVQMQDRKAELKGIMPE